MKICIYEDNAADLYPLTMTRPVFSLRLGTCTLVEKIAALFPDDSMHLQCRPFLQESTAEDYPDFAVNQPLDERTLFINGRVYADQTFVDQIDRGAEAIYKNEGEIVAAVLDEERVRSVDLKEVTSLDFSQFDLPVKQIKARSFRYLWEIIHANADAIVSEFESQQIGGRIHGHVHKGVFITDESRVYIAPEAEILPGVVLHSQTGPIYIDRNVHILPQAAIEGPCYIGPGSIIKMGAKIYGGCSIGPVCKVGGEVENLIIQGYSNKQHEGYLGHAYIGEWCNFGADTNNSDLKNNYRNVKVQVNGRLVDTGQLFVGLFMGDHCKTGINTMFNTGTVVEVGCNIYGAGFPPRYIHAFVWGGAELEVKYDLEKTLATAQAAMHRRGKSLTLAKQKVLQHLYENLDS